MTLLIACLLIYNFDMSGWWYLVAGIICSGEGARVRSGAALSVMTAPNTNAVARWIRINDQPKLVHKWLA